MAVIQSLPCNKVKKKEIEERKVKKEIVEEWNQSRCIGGRPRGCHSAWATWQLHFLSFCSIKGKGDGIRRWEESLNKFGIGRNESLFIRKIRSCRLTPPLPDASVYHNLHPIRCLSSCVFGGRTRKKGQTHTYTHHSGRHERERRITWSHPRIWRRTKKLFSGWACRTPWPGGQCILVADYWVEDAGFGACTRPWPSVRALPSASGLPAKNNNGSDQSNRAKFLAPSCYRLCPIIPRDPSDSCPWTRPLTNPRRGR